MIMCVLKNGYVVQESRVLPVLMSLRRLMREDIIAFDWLIGKLKDPQLEIPELLMKDSTVAMFLHNKEVKNIILSSIVGEGVDINLVNPIVSKYLADSAGKILNEGSALINKSIASNPVAGTFTDMLFERSKSFIQPNTQGLVEISSTAAIGSPQSLDKSFMAKSLDYLSNNKFTLFVIALTAYGLYDHCYGDNILGKKVSIIKNSFLSPKAKSAFSHEPSEENQGQCREQSLGFTGL
jgi:hypothetical protein